MKIDRDFQNEKINCININQKLQLFCQSLNLGCFNLNLINLGLDFRDEEDYRDEDKRVILTNTMTKEEQDKITQKAIVFRCLE
jgi:hypothetical protein